MPESIEQRRKRVERVAEGMGSQRALAEEIGMTEARISRALKPEMTTDRRLAPIERAISEHNLWKKAKLEQYEQEGDGSYASAFSSPGQAPYEAIGEDLEPVGSHRTIEQYDEEGRLLWAMEVRLLAGHTKRFRQHVHGSNPRPES